MTGARLAQANDPHAAGSTTAFAKQLRQMGVPQSGVRAHRSRLVGGETRISVRILWRNGSIVSDQCHDNEFDGHSTAAAARVRRMRDSKRGTAAATWQAIWRGGFCAAD